MPSTNVIYRQAPPWQPRRMLFKRSPECYRDTCFMRMPAHGKCVRLSRQF